MSRKKNIALEIEEQKYSTSNFTQRLRAGQLESYDCCPRQAFKRQTLPTINRERPRISLAQAGFRGKAKLLQQSGRGKRPNKARNLTKEEEVLWKENKFGCKTPEALVNTMWWLLTQYFGLRDRQEHREMKMDDFQLLSHSDPSPSISIFLQQVLRAKFKILDSKSVS